MGSNAEYYVPAGSVEVETEEKKSRFITSATGTVSREDAVSFFQKVRDAHPTASHHCTVFIVGNPQCAVEQGWSDDGEPSGTAGKPMLNVLQHSNIGNIAVVVTRYFGGIKLGTGGLVRAYSAAVKTALETLVLEKYFPTTNIEISFPFQFETAVRSLIEESAGTLSNVHYSTLATFEIELAERNIPDFCSRLLDRTRGAATFVGQPDSPFLTKMV